MLGFKNQLMSKKDYDVVVVGSGPNGLAAAITMQYNGLSVLVVEAKDTIGGGLRTKELTLPGFKHDVCSAIHPMAVGSPFFKQLPLHNYGLEFIYPDIAAAHPFDDGSAAALWRSLEETAHSLGRDERQYMRLMKPLLKDWAGLAPDVLGPLQFPKHPIALAKFGLNAVTSASFLSKRFKTKEAKGLWGGMAAHSIQPLSNITSSAVGLVLLVTGHLGGWPIALGGSQTIADALAAYFISLGGKIQTNFNVQSLAQLPTSDAVLFDITPKQLLKIAGEKLSSFYKWQLKRYRYGMGVFKIDWALDAPIPFTAPECRRVGTVHLGNTFGEIAGSELQTSRGRISQKPFVLLAQQTLFDASRAPEGKHTAWAYCHVPNGSKVDMTEIIENQVERFAPGFKEIILAKNTMNTFQIESYNSNYIGGDINGGVIDITQLYTRPTIQISPYRTSAKGVYLCSSSTPPGGGVHGMCGYYAAKRALKDVFNLKEKIGLSSG
jgi:phytoene dehydrogenase-like protein